LIAIGKYGHALLLSTGYPKGSDRVQSIGSGRNVLCALNTIDGLLDGGGSVG